MDSGKTLKYKAVLILTMQRRSVYFSACMLRQVMFVVVAVVGIGFLVEFENFSLIWKRYHHQ